VATTRIFLAHLGPVRTSKRYVLFLLTAHANHPAKKPARVVLDARAWEAAHRVGDLYAATAGAEALIAAELLDGLVRSGVIPPDVASQVTEDDDRFIRLWSALAPMMGRFYSLPTLQEVARGSRMSLRQTARRDRRRQHRVEQQRDRRRQHRVEQQRDRRC
jgi:hypothetical protein